MSNQLEDSEAIQDGINAYNKQNKKD